MDLIGGDSSRKSFQQLIARVLFYNVQVINIFKSVQKFPNRKKKNFTFARFSISRVALNLTSMLFTLEESSRKKISTELECVQVEGGRGGGLEVTNLSQIAWWQSVPCDRVCFALLRKKNEPPYLENGCTTKPHLFVDDVGEASECQLPRPSLSYRVSPPEPVHATYYLYR